jgi:hypothetical protein
MSENKIEFITLTNNEINKLSEDLNKYRTDIKNNITIAENLKIDILELNKINNIILQKLIKKN